MRATSSTEDVHDHDLEHERPGDLPMPWLLSDCQVTTTSHTGRKPDSADSNRVNRHRINRDAPSSAS